MPRGRFGEGRIMDVKLLGSLSARLNGRSVLPNAAKPRQVFALLALHSGQIVRVSTLLDELWGQRPPGGCMTTLQTYIHQLRRRIQEALAGDSADATAAHYTRLAKDIITTQYDGYLLMDVDTDVTEFGRLIKLGCADLGAGDYSAASAQLTQALALWRAPALADLPVGQVLGPEVISLEDARLAALDRRIEADLRLGKHVEMLGELGLLVAQNPMHEGLRAHLMTALYRSGNTMRALEEFNRLRTALVDESGIEPSPRLQQLQGAILMGDAALQLADDRGVAVR
jgi:SARP family transcriptional regulator, regulator of embCAB operon